MSRPTYTAALRGCYTPNQKLACFECHLKIINTLLKNLHHIVNSPRNSKMALNLSRPIGSLILTVLIHNLKGHWTTSASSPIFFQKSWDFYIIRSVYLCSDCMLNLTCSFNSVTKIYAFFLSVAIFKSRLLKMVATVMTAEFGTIHYYSSLEEYSEACLCSSLDRH